MLFTWLHIFFGVLYIGVGIICAGVFKAITSQRDEIDYRRKMEAHEKRKGGFLGDSPFWNPQPDLSCSWEGKLRWIVMFWPALLIAGLAIGFYLVCARSFQAIAAGIMSPVDKVAENVSKVIKLQETEERPE